MSRRRNCRVSNFTAQRDDRPVRCASSSAGSHIESLVSAALIRAYISADRADTRIRAYFSADRSDTRIPADFSADRTDTRIRANFSAVFADSSGTELADLWFRSC